MRHSGAEATIPARCATASSVPIAPTVFWGPMAFAIMGGLMVATVLTLILLPVLYVAVFGGKAETANPGVSA